MTQEEAFIERIKQQTSIQNDTKLGQITVNTPHHNDNLTEMFPIITFFKNCFNLNFYTTVLIITCLAFAMAPSSTSVTLNCLLPPRNTRRTNHAASHNLLVDLLSCSLLMFSDGRSCVHFLVQQTGRCMSMLQVVRRLHDFV